MKYNITIDGPAGAGKSTVAKKIATRLNMTYIDTGAMYRAITLLAIQNRSDKNEEIIELAKKAYINFDGHKIYLNGENVSEEIRGLEVTNKVSQVAKIPEIREIMVDLQRKMAQKQCVVMDGRDVGSTVLPEAKYKFFLTADLKERARRRYGELIKKGQVITKAEIEKDIALRDRQDQERKTSPLVIAPGAIIIDSTSKTIDEVVDEILDNIKRGGDIVL